MEDPVISQLYTLPVNKRRGVDWCFSVRDGGMTETFRYPSEEEADRALRATLLKSPAQPDTVPPTGN